MKGHLAQASLSQRASRWASTSSPLGLHFGHEVLVTGSKENAHHLTVPLSHPERVGGFDAGRGLRRTQGLLSKGAQVKFKASPGRPSSGSSSLGDQSKIPPRLR